MARIEATVRSQQRLGYTVAEAADVTSIGRDTIRQLINAGEIRVVRIGRRIVVPRAELERYIREEMA